MSTWDNVIITTISYALPLLIIAIGGIFSERSGVTNLALEGLLGFGAFSGAIFVLMAQKYFPSGSLLLIFLAFLVAAIGGMLFSILHAVLCISLKANQVISGVVINILSVAVTGFFTRQISSIVSGSPTDKIQLGVSPRYTIPVLSDIPYLGAFFKDIYPFVPLIIVLVVVLWFVLYRSRYGMHLRACGDNPQAVDAAGIRVAPVRFGAVLISGALSGFGGMCFAYSISANFSAAIYMGAGYLAIAAMIFGNWKIMPTLIACLVFGLARAIGFNLGGILNVSNGNLSDLFMILPYALTLLLLVFFSKNNRAPKALGEIYDKSKR